MTLSFLALIIDGNDPVGQPINFMENEMTNNLDLIITLPLGKVSTEAVFLALRILE